MVRKVLDDLILRCSRQYSTFNNNESYFYIYVVCCGGGAAAAGPGQRAERRIITRQGGGCFAPLQIMVVASLTALLQDAKRALCARSRHYFCPLLPAAPPPLLAAACSVLPAGGGRQMHGRTDGCWLSTGGGVI